MYLQALATDYDGTIADHGDVAGSTIAALEQVRESGRKLILVTGRELPDLQQAFDRLDLFDVAVVENGALLYLPQSGEERPVADPPSADFVAALQRRGVSPLSVGRTIVATWEPQQQAVLEAIGELKLELQIIFNKGAVMVLPSGINKASGLAAALKLLELSPHNVVGIGDAENDHAFLRACGCSAAVANALPAVKDTADFVTRGARGAGVEELVAAMLADDEALAALPRNRVPLGKGPGDELVDLKPGDVLLIAGSSGIGKSTLATALTEQLAGKQLQFAILDPEGDYSELEQAVQVGEEKVPPTRKQALDLLEEPGTSVVINTLGLELKERPGFFAELMPELSKYRAKSGRPHWLIIDEAHHLLPAGRDGKALALPDSLSGTVLITVHPDAVAPDALKHVTKILALGPEADKVIAQFCAATGEQPPQATVPDDEHVLYWHRAAGTLPKLVTVEKPRQQHKRHIRKYAEGALTDERSFYFRGPDGKLNLKAQNLMVFLQIADGVDDETWDFHFGRGDYSNWFRGAIRDDELADEAREIEAAAPGTADSRKRITEIVTARYTQPARAEA
ncbi:HAD hydrolase family protein [Devosia sp.]|uniref:HAD family hydrolase n=1 Tax=Devosia sp. TaxID=1871048 RepID=UPI003F6E92FB